MFCGRQKFVLIVRDILSHHRASFKRAGKNKRNMLGELKVLKQTVARTIVKLTLIVEKLFLSKVPS